MGKSDPQLARPSGLICEYPWLDWCRLARLRRAWAWRTVLARSSGKKRPCSACATMPGAAWLEKGDEEIGSMGVVVCWPRATESSGIIFKGCDFSPLLIPFARLIEFSGDGYGGSIHPVSTLCPATAFIDIFGDLCWQFPESWPPSRHRYCHSTSLRKQRQSH